MDQSLELWQMAGFHVSSLDSLPTLVLCDYPCENS